MKTLLLKAIANVVGFVVLFGAFAYTFSLFGMYNIIDQDGKMYSTMPFTTQSTAVEHAKKYCGNGCTVLRVVAK